FNSTPLIVLGRSSAGRIALLFLGPSVVEHLDCLSGSRVVRKISAKLLGNAPRLHVVWIYTEIVRQSYRLFFCWNTLPKFNLAEMGLVHIRGSRNHPQRYALFITHPPQPFTEILCRRGIASLFWSSHLLARYNLAGCDATKKSNYFSFDAR